MVPKRPSSYRGHSRDSFARPNAGSKLQRDRILIVCEDSVTTPRYLKALCSKLGLAASTDVKVYGEECGSAPSSVYEYAIEALEKDIKTNAENAFNRTYCVFDKDDHNDYESTLNKIHQKKAHKGKKVIAAHSIPCFEFWVLLHFIPATMPLTTADACTRLKEHIKGYKKRVTRDIYPYLDGKTDIAIVNSKHALREAIKTDTDNPSTYLHILIEDLITQSKK